MLQGRHKSRSNNLKQRSKQTNRRTIRSHKAAGASQGSVASRVSSGGHPAFLPSVLAFSLRLLSPLFIHIFNKVIFLFLFLFLLFSPFLSLTFIPASYGVGATYLAKWCTRCASPSRRKTTEISPRLEKEEGGDGRAGKEEPSHVTTKYVEHFPDDYNLDVTSSLVFRAPWSNSLYVAVPRGYDWHSYSRSLTLSLNESNYFRERKRD